MTVTRTACLFTGAAALMVAAPEAADDARLHIFHCLKAYPVGTPENDDMIVHEIYKMRDGKANLRRLLERINELVVQHIEDRAAKGR